MTKDSGGAGPCDMKIIIPYTNKTIASAGAVLVLIIGGGIVLLRRSPTPTNPSITPATPPPVFATDEGDVQVDVAHDPASTATTHQFTVTLNTHSGDLSTFDAQTNIVYRTLQGQEVLSQSVGGDRETHHRTITATFTNTALPGIIVVKNLRGAPERIFPFSQN